MKKLTIFVNEQAVYDYDRGNSIGEQQLAFLDKMDSDMKKGIKVKGELIAQPDSQQRAIFVAMNLLKALQQDNDAAISASCAYLVTRNPALIEVHANDGEKTINIEFINEH